MLQPVASTHEGRPVENTTNNRKSSQDAQWQGHRKWRFMCMVQGIVVDAILAVKHQEEHAEHVKHCQQRSENTQSKQQGAFFIRGQQDLVFGYKAREWRNTRNGQGTNQEYDISDGQYFAQSPHFANVLLATQTMDDTTRAKEQQGLEKSVCYQVEKSGYVSSHAQGEKHQTQLRYGRVGEYLLDVILLETNGCCKNRSGQAQVSQYFHTDGRQIKQGVAANGQVDTSGYHRSCVDQR